MITLFEGFKKIPNVNSVSPEFWEMIEYADWNSFIKIYNDENRTKMYKDILDEERYKLYIKYSFDEIKNFYKEYVRLYHQFWIYFKSLLDRKAINVRGQLLLFRFNKFYNW